MRMAIKFKKHGEIDSLTDKVIQFRDKRNWRQFHNPKDVALSLVLEAAEVMEHFQWKSKEDVEKYIETHRNDIAEELADVLYWVLLMSHDLDIDIGKALKEKIRKNKQRYPVKKARGRYTKYTQL